MVGTDRHPFDMRAGHRQPNLRRQAVYLRALQDGGPRAGQQTTFPKKEAAYTWTTVTVPSPVSCS